ncbi:MAG: acyltransferase family protein [Paludibacteraceae bacterium]|nr:acyltransferase family protein [Paludibacteraceae bacterium]
MQQRTSDTIRFMRLPLAIAIVFQHSHGFISSARPADADALLSWQMLDWMRGIFSWVLNGATIPAFALIAGYLFFQQWQRDKSGLILWDWRTYGRKIYHRLFSLIVPYMIWNLLAAWYMNADWNWDIFWGINSWGHGNTNIFGQTLLPTYAPLNAPLWFMRDLFILCLAAPLLYPLIRFGRWYTLGAIILIYALQFPAWTPSLALMPWFVIGAWLAIFGKDLSTIALQLWKPWLWIGILLSPVLLPLDGIWFGIVKPIMMFLLCLFYFWSATKIVERKAWKTPEILSRASVPVYAGHMGLGVLNNAAEWVAAWIPDTSSAWLLACRYFLAPTLCVAIIVVIFTLLYPSLLATILSGSKPTWKQKKG